MSFLNSVISSIDSTSVPIEVPDVRRSKPPPRPPLQEQASTSSTSKPSAKRKAEDTFINDKEKSARISGPQIDRQNTQTPNSTDRSITAKKSFNDLRPISAEKAKDGPRASPKNQESLHSDSLGNEIPKSAPKKGSFAEILARAKMKQGNQVGVITHKPKGNMSAKKEIALQKELLSQQKGRSNGKPLKPGEKSAQPNQHTSSVRQNSTAKPMEKSKSILAKPNQEKAPSKVPYQGTSKPKIQPAYKGTMKGVPSETKPSRNGTNRKPEIPRGKTRPASHNDYSDESGIEDDEDDDGRYRWRSDDESEEYSDMDAGFDEMEDENEKATRLAKKEDEAEQMRLEALKRRKEEQKKKFAQLEKEKQRR